MVAKPVKQIFYSTRFLSVPLYFIIRIYHKVLIFPTLIILPPPLPLTFLYYGIPGRFFVWKVLFGIFIQNNNNSYFTVLIYIPFLPKRKNKSREITPLLSLLKGGCHFIFLFAQFC